MFKDEKQLKLVAVLLKTLGNPYRLQIVHLLLKGEKNVSELNASVKVSQPALSQHLSKLREAGILTSRRHQRQIFYALANVDMARFLTVAVEMV